MTRATVQIADDHLMFAEPNGRYLALHYDVHPAIVKLADVAAAVKKLRPSVLLLDISFGAESSLPRLPALVRQHPKTVVVMVTGHADRRMLLEALEGGARGYVLKDGGPAELLLAIETVLSGQIYLSPELRDPDGVTRYRPQRPLSGRQRDVLQSLRQGQSLQHISDRLNIALATTDKHVRALKGNLGLPTKGRIVWNELLIDEIAPRAPGERAKHRKSRSRR
jgi:DNA-binding NarL/FixJ family response regulator